MERLPMSSNAAYCYYCPLLQRYARRIVKNESMAGVLAREVLEEAYAADGLTEHRGLRESLLVTLRCRCHYQVQAELFDRPPVDCRKCSR